MPQTVLRRLRTAAAAALLGATGLLPSIGAVTPAHAAPTHTTPAQAAAVHVTNPFAGATGYLNPDFAAEVKAQATADGGTLGTLESQVAANPTAVWMDHIGAIAGDATHLGLQAHLDHALAQQQQGTTPVVFQVVVYDLPGRDCAAIASNGELPATAAGLTTYETQYIDPIAAVLANPKYAGLRVAAIIEPDSLPNAVTNQSKPTCATATPYYESGIEYALNKLHAIPNVYDYLDIGHAGWLGWSNNMVPAGREYAKVAQATTAGFASVDGFVSDTANTTPLTEPFLTDPDLTVGGQPLKSATFYQYNPAFDEYHYDNAMYSTLVSNGFPSSIGMLVDTSRNGWGGPARPTALNSAPTTVDAYVAANKVDQKPFRGDWCNVNGAGIGARPQSLPYGAGSPIIAFLWVKPPGESDGDYPDAAHPHGDPHCDPNGTQTDGNGNTYPTDSIPGSNIPAGQWFPAQFRQLVQNAYPAFGGSTGNTGPTAPSGLTVTGTTGSSVSLSWTAATDPAGVTGYAVYRNGTKVATVTGTSYTDSGLSPATAYQYTVTAQDAAGNVSPASAAVTATTATSGGGGGSSGCSATYAVGNDWGSGFTASVSVTNTGTSATKSWTVSWSWGGNQQITNGWNATTAQSGTAVTAASQTYNGALAPKATTSFGFQATYSGGNTAPSLTCTAS